MNLNFSKKKFQMLKQYPVHHSVQLISFCLQDTYLEYRTISAVTNSHHIPNKRQNFIQLQQYMFCCLRLQKWLIRKFCVHFTSYFPICLADSNWVGEQCLKAAQDIGDVGMFGPRKSPPNYCWQMRKKLFFVETSNCNYQSRHKNQLYSSKFQFRKYHNF